MVLNLLLTTQPRPTTHKIRFPFAPVRLSVVLLTQKRLVKWFTPVYELQCIIKRSQVENSRQEPETETVGELWRNTAYSLALRAFAQLAFLSNTAQSHLPRDGTAQSGLGPPMPISNPENAPQACPQVTPVDVNLTKI